MSTKKEAEKSSRAYDDKKELKTGLSDQNQAVDRALDEARNNIKRTIEEARRERFHVTHKQSMIIKNRFCKQAKKLQIAI